MMDDLAFGRITARPVSDLPDHHPEANIEVDRCLALQAVCEVSAARGHVRVDRDLWMPPVFVQRHIAHLSP